jgi:hypothetical protein
MRKGKMKQAIEVTTQALEEATGKEWQVFAIDTDEKRKGLLDWLSSDKERKQE